LYAAGDEVGNVRGDIAGQPPLAGFPVKVLRKGQKESKVSEGEESLLVQDRAKLYSEILQRGTGPSWKEANLALQQIMNDYAGITVRSETLLKAGLEIFEGSEGEGHSHIDGR